MRRYTGSISERLIREWGGKNRKSNKEKPRKQEETKTKFAMKRKNNFMDKKAYSVFFFFVILHRYIIQVLTGRLQWKLNSI